MSLAGPLNHVRPRLDAEAVRFAVGGSFALAALGHPRFTDDLDLMVLTDDLGAVQRALAAPRFEAINEVTFRDTETLLLLDIIPVQDEAQRAAFDRSVVTPLHGASAVRVLSAEGLCLMLLRKATRGDVRRRTLRLRDAELLALDGKLEWEFVRSWARRMGYGAAYEELRVPGKPPL